MAGTNSYQIDYSNYAWSYMPLVKATASHLQWVYEQVKPVERLNTLKFTEYYYGVSYSEYDPAFGYNIGDRISGGLTYQNKQYECITQSVFGTFSITGKWREILPTFIGWEERLKYLDSRVVFEWALNKFFGTTFSQPNFDDTSKSEIYIEDNTTVDIVFTIGPDDFSSSFISPIDSTRGGNLTNNVWLGPDPVLYPQAGETFKIYVPTSFYQSLPGYNAGVSFSADKVIRTFVDTINYQGMTYKIYEY